MENIIENIFIYYFFEFLFFFLLSFLVWINLFRKIKKNLYNKSIDKLLHEKQYDYKISDLKNRENILSEKIQYLNNIKHEFILKKQLYKDKITEYEFYLNQNFENNKNNYIEEMKLKNILDEDLLNEFKLSIMEKI